jgi:hypothetical protein
VSIDGVAAQMLILRVLSDTNSGGASDEVIDDAIARVDAAGGAEAFLREVASQHRDISLLDEPARVALEIVLNEARERELLSLNAELLAERWREEEQIAGIADRDLTPPPGLP